MGFRSLSYAEAAMFRRLRDYAYRRPWRWATWWGIVSVALALGLGIAFGESGFDLVFLTLLYGGGSFLVIGAVRSRERRR